MRKAIILGVLLYGICMSLYHAGGIGRTTDADYIIDIPPTTQSKPDTSDLPLPIARDTTPYKGKWVDIN